MAVRLPSVEEDRLLAAMRSAPLVEATPEETAAFEEGLRDIQAGRTVRASEIQASLAARKDRE
jgi:predicted transcriptional regulator